MAPSASPLRSVPRPPATGASAVALADAEVDRLVDQLHDGPLQSLAFAHFAAEAALRGGDRVVARDAVQAALVELRRMLWHLRPRGAQGIGLVEALEQLSARLVEVGRPALGLVLDEECASSLEPPVVSTAYRLVQAAALAAAASDQVCASVARDGAAVVLDISGVRWDVECWRDRVHAVGGTLTERDRGVRLAVPAPPPRPEAIS